MTMTAASMMTTDGNTMDGSTAFSPSNNVKLSCPAGQNSLGDKIIMSTKNGEETAVLGKENVVNRVFSDDKRRSSKTVDPMNGNEATTKSTIEGFANITNTQSNRVSYAPPSPLLSTPAKSEYSFTSASPDSTSDSIQSSPDEPSEEESSLSPNLFMSNNNGSVIVETDDFETFLASTFPSNNTPTDDESFDKELVEIFDNWNDFSVEEKDSTPPLSPSSLEESPSDDEDAL